MLLGAALHHVWPWSECHPSLGASLHCIQHLGTRPALWQQVVATIWGKVRWGLTYKCRLVLGKPCVLLQAECSAEGEGPGLWVVVLLEGCGPVPWEGGRQGAWLHGGGGGGCDMPPLPPVTTVELASARDRWVRSGRESICANECQSTHLPRPVKSTSLFFPKPTS